MADRVLPGPVDASTRVNEAVCVHTSKIFDSCKDKDCIEDLRVIPTTCSQPYIDTALSIRPRSTELLFARVRVDEISFNRGYYTVDVTYFYKVRGETFPGGHFVTGLCIFDKRVMLYGSEGSAKVFSSNECGIQTCNPSMPTAVVEAVDPITLSMKLVDSTCSCGADTTMAEVPDSIRSAFDDALLPSDPGRLWFVTLGQFSIIRLERDTSLIIPVYDYCVPDKECVGSSDEDPCTLFGKIRFPMEEFYPPDNLPCEEA